MVIVAEDMRRQTNRADQQMQYQLRELRKEAERMEERSMERHRKLVMEVEHRRQTSSFLRERLEEVARRVGRL